MKQCFVKKLEKMIVYVVIVFLLFENVFGTTLQVHAAEAPYGKSYSITQLLSDYQYFIESNANISFSHNVGALAVGGDTIIGNFGDGAVEDSYLGNIISAGNYNNGQYFQTEPDYTGYIGKKVYYGTASSAPAYATQWSEGTPYIDFAAAFSAIKTESTALASNGALLTLADIQSVDIAGQNYNAIVIPFDPAGTTNITIPREVYNSANAILISGLSASKMDSFQSQQYTINILGADALELAENPWDKQAPTAIPVAFEYNIGQNVWMQNSPYILKDMTAGVIQAGQMNMGGMKLIWNVPEATSVSTHNMPGHIVAPNANVTITGGRFEGNVIAKNVNNATAEGHFYPFSSVAQNNGTAVTIENIQLKNTYENDGITGLNSGSCFNVYTDAACSTAPIISNLESARTNTSDPLQVSVPGSSLAVSTSYYIKQVTVATGYEIVTDVYECKVAADGTITYKKVGSSDPYSSTVPTIHNLMEVVTPVTINNIQITKTFENNEITGLSSGAFFNLYADAACSTAPVVSNSEAVRGNTSDPFVVSIAGTALAVSTTYYLKEVTAPTGYDLASAVYECKVAADGTITYKLQGSADSFSSTNPICNNTKTVIVPEDLVLIKTFENDEITGLTSGALFNLYTDAACSTAPIVTNKEATRSNTSLPFSVLIAGSGLSLSTTYYLKEVSAPTGYDSSSEVYECKVLADGNINYKVQGSADAYSSVFPTCNNIKQVNVPVTVGNIQLFKTFADNGITGLSSGAFFNLYTDAGCSTAPIVTNAEAVRSNTIDPFTVTIAGSGLSAATTYYLKEVTAPTGYDKSANVYECKVAADGSITYKIQGSASSYSSTIPICSNAVHVVTVNNIQLTKTFADDAITGLNSGAFFTLYADSACVTTPVRTNVEAVRSSISNPFIVTIDGTGLSAATTYYLKEVTAPAGYDMSTNIYECKVAADGSVTYKIKGSADAYSSTFPTCINVVHTPTPAPLPMVPSDIAIIKTFENNKITGLASGAYFTLYSDAACTIPVVNNMQAIRSNLTDSFKATIPGNLLSVSMSYYLKEVTAPSGYAKSNNIYICNIDAAGVVTYKLLGSTNLFSASFPSCNNTEVQNPTLGAIKIKILEKGTGRAISNAVVYLTLPNGQKKMFSTDANGEIAISNQEIGTYSLVVQSVPTGYQYDVGATYSLDVASNNVAEKTITVETVTTNGSSNTTGTTTTTTTAAQTSAVKLKKLDKVPATGMR